jgi:hypothetical protein
MRADPTGKAVGLGSFLVALALVVAVGVGSAIAVIPNNGTYYACLVKKTGAVTVINYPKVKCATGQKLIKWNAKGPAGPQGAQGPAGPADWNAIPNIPAVFADGVDNEGVTGVRLTRVTGVGQSLPTGESRSAIAECPAGAKVISGGYLTTAPGDFSVLQSLAFPDGTGWSIKAIYEGSDTGIIMAALAQCMSVEPTGAITVAKKGLLPASLKKAMKKQGR